MSFFSQLFKKKKNEPTHHTEPHTISHQVQSFPDGSTYDGGLENGKFNGHGVFPWPDGTKYEGEFVDGDKCGTGKNYFHNGDVYCGDFKYDKPHGRGVTVYANGDRYEGGYYAGLRDGTGTFNHSSTGERYEGLSFALSPGISTQIICLAQ